ncbi:MAG: hypothetical protein U0X20_12335 [Caldilineaceae bacterium]
MSDDKEGLETRILNWLKTQGYPLEMWVADKLEASGFSVTMTDYYKDPKTNDLREIDVTGMSYAEISGRESPINVCVRIECKSSKDKPWVVFMRDGATTFSEWPIEPPFVPCSKAYQDLWLTVSLYPRRYSAVRNLPIDLQLPVPLKVGHSMIQVKFTSENNTDVAYKAITSAVNASIAHVKEAEQQVEKGSGIRLLWVTFPAIVIDGQLFECIQHEGDQLELREVNYTCLQWKGVAQEETSPAVVLHVCTREGFADFLAHMAKARLALGHIFVSAERLLARLPKRRRFRLRQY